MKTVFIACDSKDPKLGSFLTKSANDFASQLPKSMCKVNNVDCMTPCVPTDMNHLVLFMHGNDEHLKCANEYPFDLSRFAANGIVISFACLTGKSMGPRLVDNGVQAFIGFTEPYRILRSFEDALIRCQSAAAQAMTAGKEATEIMTDLQSAYTDAALAIHQATNDPIAASIIYANGNAIILHGDGGFKAFQAAPPFKQTDGISRPAYRG